MPGFYAAGEYDIAGFIVGVVEKSDIVDGRTIRPGDVIVALPSSGLHTNGYSLARRVLFETAGFSVDTMVNELGTSVGAALLAPHRSYLEMVRPLLQNHLVKGMAHITGGGITDNLPRSLPEGCSAEIDLASWTVPPLFRLIGERGAIANDEMLRAFNMGAGFLIMCSSADFEPCMSLLAEAGERAWRIGRIVPGERTVRYIR
jgi:phosphoribosylformylglycinamidine cyclo-ligase